MKNLGLKAFERICKNVNSYSYTEEFKKDKMLIKNMLKSNDILRIIFEAPFIIEALLDKKELGKNATDRYLWGTISEEDVKKVKEFFKDGKVQKLRNKSK